MHVRELVDTDGRLDIEPALYGGNKSQGHACGLTVFPWRRCTHSTAPKLSRNVFFDTREVKTETGERQTYHRLARVYLVPFDVLCRTVATILLRAKEALGKNLPPERRVAHLRRRLRRRLRRPASYSPSTPYHR